jgi:hypothetical protein
MYWYLNNQGQVTTGTMQMVPEGLLFPERYTNAKGEEVELKSVWTRDGADRYRVSVSQRAGSEWKSLWAMTLTRKGAAPE